ncbi:MAG: metallophosphoesterase [Verrucomicrobiota bacterium]
MKILLVADLHYTLRQWDWLGAVAEKFDLVVIAGDLLDIGSIVPLDAQIVVIRKYLDKLRGQSPLLVSSGNHDLLPGDPTPSAKWLQNERSDGLLVDGDHYEQDGTFFSLIPWYESDDDIRRIESQLEAHAALAKGRRWAWIYHAPAKEKAVAWNGRNDWGDPKLPAWIERFSPEFVLGGHVHQAPFVRNGAWIDEHHGCWLFNGGRQPGSVPTFTVIDTELPRAVWVSAEEAEQAELQLPLERKEFEGRL